MDIRFDLYRIFYFAAKSGSFSAAAKILFTSQPAVSQSIKQLEQQLGASLFLRTPKGILLTSEGRLLFSYIEKSYGLISAAEKKFAEFQQRTRGSLHMAVCSAVCKHELMLSLAEYHQLYPNLKINILDTSSEQISQLLTSGQIELGILNPTSVDLTPFDIISEISLQDCFVAGKKIIEKLPKKISLKQLASSYPFISLQKNSSTRYSLESFFQEHQVSFAPQMEVSHLDLLTAFTIKNMGIAFVPKEYVQQEIQNGDLGIICLEEPILLRHLFTVKLKDFLLSPAANAFIDIFLKNSNTPDPHLLK